MTETQAPEAIEHTITQEETRPGSLLVLSIEMPEQVVIDRVESVLEDFRKDAALPGFRRGKAPKELVRRRLGAHARGEALNRVVPDLCNNLIEERDIESLAEPKIDNLVNEEGKPITFDLVLEVKPAIDLPTLNDIAVEVTEVEVNDDMIAHQLEHIQKANAVMVARDGEPAQQGDAVSAAVKVTDHEGNEVEQHSGEEMLIRTGEETGNPVPQEVVEACVGKSAGEEFTVEVSNKISVASDEEGGEPEEKEVTWTWALTVKEVKSVTLPDMDDDFAKDVGDFDTLEDLKARIREDMEKNQENRERDEAVNAVMTQLMEKTSFECPATLVARTQYNTMMRDHQYLQQMGMSLADLEAQKDDYMENARKEAEKQVRAELLLDAVGQSAEIEVDDADVDTEIERMAEQAGRKPLAIRAQIEARKQLDALKEQIMRRKIAEHILEAVTIKKIKA